MSTSVAEKLVTDWQAARLLLKELERAEHPDLVDHHGRVWTWKYGDLYVHDGCLAWPKDHVLDGTHGLPGPALADNPNYRELCPTCRQGWPEPRTKETT